MINIAIKNIQHIPMKPLVISGASTSFLGGDLKKIYIPNHATKAMKK